MAPVRHVVATHVLLLVVVGLAGCVTPVDQGAVTEPEHLDHPVVACSAGPRPTDEGPDVSREHLRVWVSADGSWRLGVPLPVSDDGTNVDDWIAAASTQGDVSAVSRLDTERGPVLLIGGEGDALLCAAVRRAAGDRGYAEQFLDARFTTQGASGSGGFWAWGEGGPSFWLLWDARSKYCDASYAGQGLVSPEAAWAYMSGGAGGGSCT